MTPEQRTRFITIDIVIMHLLDHAAMSDPDFLARARARFDTVLGKNTERWEGQAVIDLRSEFMETLDQCAARVEKQRKPAPVKTVPTTLKGRFREWLSRD